ncbi:MAG: enoyl-CoA hydratase-related protein [Kiritimatiellales bacterium]
MSYVELEKKDHIGIVTMNRPEALNALNAETFVELENVLDKITADDEIYVVIITGAGRSFVAGADIGSMLPLNAVEGKLWGEHGNNVFLRLENLAKPVIAAINGFALGGGNELAMACDIRLASEKAKFGQPEVGLGITPGFGGTQRLPRIVGYGQAMRLILSGKTINAREAEKIGLVDGIYPPEELLPAALELAQAIAGQAQVAVRQSKRCIRKGMQTDIATGTAYEAEAFGICFATEDQKQAMSAFVDKRKPEPFKNK